MRYALLYSMSVMVFLSGAVGLSPPVGAQVDDRAFQLADVRTFDVHGFERHYFAVQRDALPSEVIEYARTAIQQHRQLRYDTPGEAVLHFHCASNNCNRVRVELTHGEDGPVLWQSEHRYRSFFSPKAPNSRQFAQRIVQQLAQDYIQARQQQHTGTSRSDLIEISPDEAAD